VVFGRASIIFDVFGMGDPTSRWAIAAIKLRIIWSHKPHHYDKLEITSGGLSTSTRSRNSFVSRGKYTGCIHATVVTVMFRKKLSGLLPQRQCRVPENSNSQLYCSNMRIYEWTETTSPMSFIFYAKARIRQSICGPNEIHTETVCE
jgi:hypothetical protein